MVGKDPKKVRFYDLMAKYRNKPFSWNGWGQDGTYGCFGFIYAYLKDRGVKVPSSCWTIRGTWTIENYGDLIQLDRDFAESVMDAFYDVIGEEATTPLAGDILICRNEQNKGRFPAVYVGNGHAMAAILDDRVRVFSIDKHNTLVRARRVG